MTWKKYILIIVGTIFIMIISLIINVIYFSDSPTIRANDDIKEGNKFYGKAQYENALKEYNSALFKDSLSYGAEYNKASTYNKKKRYDLEDSTYQNAARKYQVVNRFSPFENDEFLSKTFHNKGNCNMTQVTPLDSIIMIGEDLKNQSEQPNAAQNADYKNQYQKLAGDLTHVQKAIGDYKNSLREGPNNDSTRFNLAYAQECEKRLLDILKDITPPDNQNQQNQNKDQQNQQNQNQQDQQDQQNQDQDQNDKDDERKETDEKNGQKDQNADLSKENAEQILKAMEKDEENTLKKVRLQRDKNQQRRRIEKNW